MARDAKRRGRLPWPFRRFLALNEHLSSAAFRASRGARIPSQRGPRASCQRHIGIDSTIDPTAWRLRVIGASGDGEAAFPPRRDQDAAACRDDDRAEVHRGLEHGRALGGARWQTSRH